ncbi:MAG: HU family DNA-binding protein [Chitinophagales bacterium]
MNKGELIDAMANDTGLTKTQVTECLDSMMTNIRKALKKGDKVTLVGFGTYSVSKRAARTGRNPQTGKAIKIAARNVVRFKAGKDLSAAV